MLSVADIIEAQGKVWDRPFSGKLLMQNAMSEKRKLSICNC